MYVIIGGSAAAIGCIEGIRQVDKKGEITLVTDENKFNYSRPLISYLLEGKTTEEKMCYRPDEWFEQKHVTVISGVKAEKLDTKAKTIKLSNGDTLPYDSVLIATGSRPFVPPTQGYDTVENKHTFMTLESAKALAASLNKDSRVLIVGAGLTGVKCAEGIRSLCRQITIVDLAPRVLPAVLDEHGSQMIQKRMEENGVKFFLSDAVEKFDKNKAVLKSGNIIEFDVLVTAVGVRPNTQLVSDAGGEVNKGIVIDNGCRTTLPFVYAAGDCTEGYDAVSGKKRMLPLWCNAILQGETAGHNMAGGNADFTQGMAINASGVFGLHMVTAGEYSGESYIEEKDGSYKRLITSDGLLKGVIMVGDVARSGIYTNLIRKRKPLAEIDFELIKESPQLMAFSKGDRAKQLGGEV